MLLPFSLRTSPQQLPLIDIEQKDTEGVRIEYIPVEHCTLEHLCDVQYMDQFMGKHVCVLQNLVHIVHQICVQKIYCSLVLLQLPCYA